MNTTPYLLEQLVDELQKIAKKNKDEFNYKINLTPQRDKSLYYEIVVSETADNHVFTSGVGKTIPEAIQNLLSEIDNDCDQWEYKR